MARETGADEPHDSAASLDTRVVVGAAARAYPGEVVSGDGWTVQSTPRTWRLAVIDGLGHGDAAAAATTAAIAALDARPDVTLRDALSACHTALHGTRGAAMWLGEIDFVARTLTILGAGNVQGQLLQAGTAVRLLTARGIVGAVLPHFREETVTLEDDWVLVVYTDGIRERFDVRPLLDGHAGDPRHVAQTILNVFARSTDDATIVVASSHRAAQ